MADGTKEKMDSAKKLLYPIAEQHKESEPDTEMRFFYAGENDDDDIVTSLRTFAHLSTKDPLVVIIDIPDQQVSCQVATHPCSATISPSRSSPRVCSPVGLIFWRFFFLNSCLLSLIQIRCTFQKQKK